MDPTESTCSALPLCGWQSVVSGSPANIWKVTQHEELFGCASSSCHRFPRLTYRSWSSSVAKVILRTPCARVSNAELSCSISNGPLADHPPSVTEPYCKHLPSQWARLAVFCLLNTTGKASESHQRARGLCNTGIWPKRALRGLIYAGTTGVEAVQEPRGDWRGCAVLLCSSELSGCWKNHKGCMRGCRWCDKKSIIAVVKWWVCGQWVREGMVDGAMRSSHLCF